MSTPVNYDATPPTRHRRFTAPLLAVIVIAGLAACRAPDSVTSFVKPDATNTGWQPTGVKLTPYTGPMNITTPGTVIDGKDISGQLTISANNVTIQRSRIRSGDNYAIYVASNARNLAVTDSELDGEGNYGNDSAISSHDFTVTRCDIHGWVDGFKANSNVTVANSWLHDFATGHGNHNDGLQISGSGNITIVGNLIEARSQSESGSMNASVYTDTDYGIRPNHVVVRGNWINAGGYFIRIDATDFTLDNNRFGRWYGYGLITATPQSTWTNTGNVWDDTGRPISQ